MVPHPSACDGESATTGSHDGPVLQPAQSPARRDPCLGGDLLRMSFLGWPSPVLGTSTLMLAKPSTHVCISQGPVCCWGTAPRRSPGPAPPLPTKTWFDVTLPQGQLPPPMLHHLCRLCCSSPPFPPSLSPFCCSQGKRWKSLHVLKKSYKKPSLMVDFWSGKSRLCRAIRD